LWLPFFEFAKTKSGPWRTREGQSCSFIHQESYARYDRDLFLATLNDWGWFGDPADAPEWYTGKPCSE
jgi:hypothetical protein